MRELTIQEALQAIIGGKKVETKGVNAACNGEFGATFKKPANNDDFIHLALALTTEGYTVKHVGDMMGVEWSDFNNDN